MQKKIVTAIIILTLCLGSYAMAAKVDGLVLYFSFDEGAGGTVNDTSGNNNNGKIIKGTKWVAGKFGKGLEFGGADSVEVVNSKSLEFIDEISLMLWIKPALDGTEWQGLITKGPDGGESFEFLLNKAGHFHTGWKFAGGRICPNRGAGGAVAKGEWQHAAITYKPGEWLCYLNGEVLDKQVANDKLVNLEDPLILGDEKGMSRFYTGIMDEVAIFNKALTEKEVKMYMDTSMAKFLAVESKGKLATTWASVKY